MPHERGESAGPFGLGRAAAHTRTPSSAAKRRGAPAGGASDHLRQYLMLSPSPARSLADSPFVSRLSQRMASCGVNENDVPESPFIVRSLSFHAGAVEDSEDEDSDFRLASAKKGLGAAAAGRRRSPPKPAANARPSLPESPSPAGPLAFPSPLSDRSSNNSWSATTTTSGDETMPADPEDAADSMGSAASPAGSQASTASTASPSSWAGSPSGLFAARRMFPPLPEDTREPQAEFQAPPQTSVSRSSSFALRDMMGIHPVPESAEELPAGPPGLWAAAESHGLDRKPRRSSSAASNMSSAFGCSAGRSGSFSAAPAVPMMARNAHRQRQLWMEGFAGSPASTGVGGEFEPDFGGSAAGDLLPPSAAAKAAADSLEASRVVFQHSVQEEQGAGEQSLRRPAAAEARLRSAAAAAAGSASGQPSHTRKRGSISLFESVPRKHQRGSSLSRSMSFDASDHPFGAPPAARANTRTAAVQARDGPGDAEMMNTGPDEDDEDAAAVAEELRFGSVPEDRPMLLARRASASGVASGTSLRPQHYRIRSFSGSQHSTLSLPPLPQQPQAQAQVLQPPQSQFGANQQFQQPLSAGANNTAGLTNLPVPRPRRPSQHSSRGNMFANEPPILSAAVPAAALGAPGENNHSQGPNPSHNQGQGTGMRLAHRPPPPASQRPGGRTVRSMSATFSELPLARSLSWVGGDSDGWAQAAAPSSAAGRSQSVEPEQERPAPAPMFGSGVAANNGGGVGGSRLQRSDSDFAVARGGTSGGGLAPSGSSGALAAFAANRGLAPPRLAEVGASATLGGRNPRLGLNFGGGVASPGSPQRSLQQRQDLRERLLSPPRAPEAPRWQVAVFEEMPPLEEQIRQLHAQLGQLQLEAGMVPEVSAKPNQDQDQSQDVKAADADEDSGSGLQGMMSQPQLEGFEEAAAAAGSASPRLRRPQFADFSLSQPASRSTSPVKQQPQPQSQAHSQLQQRRPPPLRLPMRSESTPAYPVTMTMASMGAAGAGELLTERSPRSLFVMTSGASCGSLELARMHSAPVLQRSQTMGSDLFSPAASAAAMGNNNGNGDGEHGETEDDTDPNRPFTPVERDDIQLYNQPRLPHKSVDQCPMLTSETLAGLMRGKFNVSGVDRFLVIDCRYQYEYDGGHIMGAVNMRDKDHFLAFFEANKRYLGRAAIILHCEFSKSRGPKACKYLRALDRESWQWPLLTFPDVYLLEGGYRTFYSQYPELCWPRGYIEMFDDRFSEQLKIDMMRHRQEWESSRGKNRSRAQLQQQRPRWR